MPFGKPKEHRDLQASIYSIRKISQNCTSADCSQPFMRWLYTGNFRCVHKKLHQSPVYPPMFDLSCPETDCGLCAQVGQFGDIFFVSPTPLFSQQRHSMVTSLNSHKGLGPCHCWQVVYFGCCEKRNLHHYQCTHSADLGKL